MFLQVFIFRSLPKIDDYFYKNKKAVVEEKKTDRLLTLNLFNCTSSIFNKKDYTWFLQFFTNFDHFFVFHIIIWLKQLKIMK